MLDGPFEALDMLISDLALWVGIGVLIFAMWRHWRLTR